MQIKLLFLVVATTIVYNCSALPHPDIRKVYTPPSFGSTSTTPLTPTTSKRSYAVAAGGLTSATTPTPPPRKSAPTTPPPPSNLNLTFVVAARDVPVKKKGAKVDPYIKVSQRTATLQEIKDWKALGQTATLKENNNPDFLKVFSYYWTRGKNEQLRFELFAHHSITKDEVLGTADIRLDDFVLNNNPEVSLPLNGSGKILVKRVIPVAFKLFARTVPKLDTLDGASDPFVECFWRKGKDGNDTLFYKTKVVKDSENPDWNETIPFENYQKGAGMWWHFKVHDEDSLSNDFIGEALMEVDPFVEKRAAKILQLSKDPKNKATLTVMPA